MATRDASEDLEPSHKVIWVNVAPNEETNPQASAAPGDLAPPVKNNPVAAHSDAGGRWAAVRHAAWRGVRTTIADGWQAFQRWPRLKQVALIVGAVLLVAVVLCVDVPSMSTLRNWSDTLGAWFPAVFFLLYVTITQFPIPRTVLTLSSGILFGPWVGCLIALSATPISSALSLTLVRHLVGERILSRVSHPAVATINARLRARGWLAVASLRMIAAVPFSVLNYTAALSDVRVLPFALATLVGSAPGTIATVFLGDALVGSPSPALMGVTVVLFTVGMCGLILDSKLPVRPKEPVRQENTADQA